MKPIQVLLVEDNPGDVELTRQALASSKLDITLTSLDDGEKALRYLRGEAPYRDAPRPDLVLLDLNLPKKDGGEVLREIKADAGLKALPVVVLTSSEAESEVSKCYAAGANCYIVKPVDFGSFMSVVSAIESFWFTVVKMAPGKKPHHAPAGQDARQKKQGRGR